VTAIRLAFALLSPAARRRWAALVPLALAGAAAEALGAAALYLLIRLVGDPASVTELPLLSTLATPLGAGGARRVIVLLTVLLAVFQISKNAFHVWQTSVQSARSAEGRAELAQRALATYLAAPYAFHLRRNSAELIHNVTGATEEVYRRVLTPAVAVASESLVVLAITTVLAFTAPVVTLALVIVLGGAGAALLRITRRRAARWGARAWALDREVLQGVQQTLGAVKEITVLGREGFFFEQFARRQAELARLRRWSETLAAVPRLLVESVFVLSALAVVVVLVELGHQGDEVLPLLGLYAYAGFRVIPSANRILMHLNEIVGATAAVRALHADLAAAPAAPLAFAEPAAALRFESAIVLARVSLTYEGAPRPALAEIDLTIRRGESVGVVGATGAGKSTLLDVLIGLLPPTSGQVLIDGCDLRQAPRAWQRMIGYVPQTVVLVDDSLRRNIALGVPDEHVDPARLREAVRMAQLDAVVGALPEGLATRVGERGVRLAGGERQRVGIARALYHGPEVLVLDEATSALDAQTEAEVLRAMTPLRGVRTVIVVAHRLSSVRPCDRLVFLAEGRIAGEGDFEALIRGNEAFRRLAAGDLDR